MNQIDNNNNKHKTYFLSDNSLETYRTEYITCILLSVS